MSANDKDGEDTANDTTAPEARRTIYAEAPANASVGGGLANTLTREESSSGPNTDPLRDSLASAIQRYEVRGELGRGGQSVVHRAFDTRLARDVAIKELHADSSDAAKDRFWREARITARLEHPNIVPVYEIGKRSDGTLYCVQKLIRSDARDGQTRTLRAVLNDAKTLDARLQLLPQFLAVCQGISYAHAQGVLHRDLKPENIVLGQFGETVILDWGLAREVGDASRPRLPVSGETANTVAGIAYGTPAYMSPEQARGEVVKIDARSDVWSLGAMLFELLTGRTPFVGRGAMDVVEQVKSAPVPEVRTLEPYAPPELAAISRRAMQRDPAQRYPSAAALVDEVIAWQTSRRVSAYDYSLVESARLFVERHSAVAGAGLAMLLTVLIAAGLVLGRYREARRANAHTLIEKARAADKQLRWNEAALYFTAARLYDDNPETQWGVRTLGKRRVPKPRPLEGQRKDVKALAWSPDGTRLAAGVVGGALVIFDAATGGQQGSVIAHKNADVLGVAWSADGKHVASAGSDGRALLWDATQLTSDARELASGGEMVNKVALSPDGKFAAVAYEKGGVDLVFVDTQERRRIHPQETDKQDHPVYGVSIDPRSERVALVTWAGLLEIRALDGTLIQSLPRVAPSLLDVKYSPDGKSLAVAGNDKFVRWYDVDESGRVRSDRVRLLEGHDSKVYAVAFSQDSKLLASVGTDQTMRLWDGYGRPMIGRSLGGLGELEALALSPDGREVAVGGQGNRGSIYTLPEDDAIGVKPADRLEGLASQPGLSWYAYASGEGPYVFQNDALVPLEQPELPHGSARELGISRRGGTIVWCCGSAVCYADGPSLTNVRRIEYPFADDAPKAGHFVRAVAAGADGKWVAAADQQGELRLWSVPDGAQKFVLRGHTKSIYSVDVSPDGRWLATGSYDHTIRLWDLADGSEVATFKAHALGVRRVRFSPDGKLLASTGWDRTVRLWDVEKRTLLRTCTGHEDHVFGLDWSPDGIWLVTAGRDGTFRVWDPQTCRVLATQLLDESQAYGLAVWGDGKGLSYSGASIHRFEFQTLRSPSEQFHAVEESTGLTLDEEHLEAVSSASSEAR